MSGGATNSRGFWKAPPPRPMDYRVWNWLAVCYGAKATFYWCYLEESTGPEAGGFGMVRANGALTDRSKSAAETAQVLRDCWPTVRDYVPTTEVGILYDPDVTQQLFAMEANDNLYVQSHIGYYRALWRSDLFARYVTYSSLEDLDGLQVLIIPMCLTLPESAAAAVRTWVANGGTVIAEARTGLYDARGFNQPVLPAMGLSELFGVVEEESLCSDPENRPPLNNPAQEPWPEQYHSIATIKTDGSNSFAARGYFVPLQCRGAAAIATTDEHCLASFTRFEGGSAYYIGTYLGLALFKEDKGAHQFLRSILAKHVSSAVRGNALRPRIISTRDSAILAVFNDSREATRSDCIELPGNYVMAMDVYDPAQQLVIQNRRLEVQVEPESVRVFKLTV